MSRFLLESGGFVDPLEYRGFTPLHLAAKAGADEAAAMLLDWGADVNAMGMDEYKYKITMFFLLYLREPTVVKTGKYFLKGTKCFICFFYLCLAIMKPPKLFV